MFAAVLAIVTANDIPWNRLENLMPPADFGSRVTGPFGNPNNFGQLLAYASLLLVGLLITTRSVWLRIGLIVSLAIMGFALTMSLSRGAIVALLAGLVVLAFTRSKAVGLAALAGTLILVGVGYTVFLDVRLTTETGGVSAEALTELAASDESRLSAVLAGPALFATSPIFGIGFGHYKYLSGTVTDAGAGLVAHNWYGTVLAEQGLLGVVLWVAVLVTVWHSLRSRPARQRSIGYSMLGAFVVGCLFLEPPTSFQTSIVPTMFLAATIVGAWAAPDGTATATGERQLGERAPRPGPGGDPGSRRSLTTALPVGDRGRRPRT
jgi:O-antigen ligase